MRSCHAHEQWQLVHTRRSQRTYSTLRDPLRVYLMLSPRRPTVSHFAVYDGHGGASCAQFVAQRLHEAVLAAGLLTRKEVGRCVLVIAGEKEADL